MNLAPWVLADFDRVDSQLSLSKIPNVCSLVLVPFSVQLGIPFRLLLIVLFQILEVLEILHVEQPTVEVVRKRRS